MKFMKPAFSVPCLEHPAIRPYPKPDEYNPNHHFLFFLRFVLILSSHLLPGHPSGLFLSNPT